MEDLMGKAHAYLCDKGCKSMSTQYSAFEIEKMLVEFTQQHVKNLNTPIVIKSVCPICNGKGYYNEHNDTGIRMMNCECKKTVS